MGWLSSLSDAHVKFATLFDKIEKLGKSHADLSDQTVLSRERIARIEGMLSQTSHGELHRQVSEINERLTRLESFIHMKGSASGNNTPTVFIDDGRGSEKD